MLCASCGHKSGCCFWGTLTKVLLIIGGINWGLVGAGMLMVENWNIVNIVFGGMPTVEAIIYVVVGIAALVSIFGCRCKKCTTCAVAPAVTTPTSPNM